jgi:hypothetical protein
MKQIEFIKTIKHLEKREFNPSETLQLLNSYGFKLWSWGINKKINVENKILLLKVNGHNHKGWVVITLDWSDTYTVDIVSNKGEVLKNYEMVYFDELFTVIDDNIERIPEYRN